jgi:RNA polymerase sigma-B factor
VEQVAEAIGVEPEDVLDAMGAASAYRATSLDAPRAGGDDEPGETIGEAVGDVDAGFQRAEQRAMLHDLMRSLAPRERDVIRLRFEDDLTQAEIGKIVGISQMQVSRVLRRAIARLRVAAEHGGERADTGAGAP